MNRLVRALGYVTLGAVVLRWLAPGSQVLMPWLPGMAVAVVGVAFGLERLGSDAGLSRRAPVGLGFGLAAAAISTAIYGAPWQSPVHGLATCLAAGVCVPLAGVILESFPGPDRRAHWASGGVGLAGLMPLAVHVLPWWLHPITHWNPLFWVHHAFLRLYLAPAELEATGIRMPATFEWEYTAVPIFEAAVFAWWLRRRMRQRQALAS